MEPTALIVTAIAIALLAVGLSVRMVPVGHVGVVVRAGRPVRSRPAGLVPLVPGFEQLRNLALLPPPLEPVEVVATTRDGVEVRMTLSVLWRIDDVDRAAAQSDPCLVVAEAVERSVRHEVGALDLRSLLEDREGMLGRLTGDQTGLLAATGVCLLDADLLATEIRVGPHLLDLLSVTATCRPT